MTDLYLELIAKELNLLNSMVVSSMISNAKNPSDLTNTQPYLDILNVQREDLETLIKMRIGEYGEQTNVVEEADFIDVS